MEERSKQDCVIVGAGPAGLFAAHQLMGKGLKVLVIDKGPDVGERSCVTKLKGTCARCQPCQIMSGVGGAGTFSDGTLNLHPSIGGDLKEFTGGDSEKAWNLVFEVDELFLKYGAPQDIPRPKDEEVEGIRRKAAAFGAEFIPILQRHIGSDYAPALIKDFKDDLVEHGIDFRVNTKVNDLWITNGTCQGVILEDGSAIPSSCTLLAPGRIGSSWVEMLVKKHSFKARFGPLDLGVRVEVPSIVMDWLTQINRDPKFHIRTSRYDDFVRTFCANKAGFVVMEKYEDFVGVNGHSHRNMSSSNTNFALLVTIELTQPLENTTIYGECVARLTSTIGGGRPIIQRLGDLRRGQRSTPTRLKRNLVQGTLQQVTPGDISMALPHRIVEDLKEGLEVLDKIIPGVASDSTLLYAPEVKFYSMRFFVDDAMQTSIKGLFAAGDGAGLSKDLVNAAATGILAGRGIQKWLEASS